MPRSYQAAPQQYQAFEYERVRGDLRDGRGLCLRYNAAEYMFHPSGQFRGSNLEGALAQSSVPSLYLYATAKSAPESARLAQTLAALRGCTLAMHLDIKNSRYNQDIMPALRGISGMLTELDARKCGL